MPDALSSRGRRLLVVVLSLMGVVGVAVPVEARAVPSVTPSTSSADVATMAMTVIDPVRVIGDPQPVVVRAGQIQYLTIPGRFGQPDDVRAARLVVTVAPHLPGVEITVHPSGGVVPSIPTLRAPDVGQPVVRAITTAIGSNGQIEFRSSGSASLTVDLVGVLRPTTTSATGRLVSVDPIRLGEIDGTLFDVAVPSNVPSDTTGVLVSVTAWNASSLGTWSTADGVTAAVVSLGRVDTGEVLVRPENGRILLRSSVRSRFAVEIVGWFTGSSAPTNGEGLYVSSSPVRILDTTSSPNPLGFGVAIHENWTVENSLSALGSVSAVDVRIGSIAAHGAGAITIHGAGRSRTGRGQMFVRSAGVIEVGYATVEASTRGIAAHSAAGTDLTLDVVGWYTGVPASTESARPLNAMPSAHDFPGLIAIPRTRTLAWVLGDPNLVDIDPVHLPESRSPNQPGNTAIFGHRTSHGREFRNIDRLRVGDPVYLAVEGRIYVYSTTSVEVLSPLDPRLYASTSNDQTLTLVACHPPGSIKYRVVAFARLVNTVQF